MKSIILILLVMLTVSGGDFFHRSPVIGGGMYAVLLIVLLMRIKALPSEVSHDDSEVSMVVPVPTSNGDNCAGPPPPVRRLPTRSSPDAVPSA